jgi:predicted lipoprotein with Yx(FWY)xxD motif
MPRPVQKHPALLALALAGLVAVGVTAIAVAKSFTLRVAKNVHVTNTPTKTFRVKAVDTHEAVAVGSTGFAVYTFQGETTHHIICKKTKQASTNCWAFWPPVSAGSGKGLSKQSGIRGNLGSFHNHGMLQLTLNGQPVYYFTPDLQAGNKHQATGDELKTFGSIWHIVKGGATTHASTSPSPMTTTTTTTTTPMNPYSY